LGRSIRATSDAAPDWSPDGTQLVFNSNRSGNSEVYRMKASPEGRLNKPVNLSRSPAMDSAPSWSPDGRKIAFTSARPGSDGTTDWEIWRMKATDGATPTNLTNNNHIDFDAEWQPVP
jgi:Tol biopolymer transport system component